MPDREAAVVETFVALVDTLVEDYDAIDLMGRLAERSSVLLGMDAAGVILADPQGDLTVAGASSERSRLLEMFAVAIDTGPCIDTVRTGRAVSCDDIAAEADRWPRFAAGAAEAGFRAFHALPMRLRDEVIGVLTLINTEPHHLAGNDRRVGQALADAATIGLLHQRALHRAETVAEQLQVALTSRIIIEQAKGVLAARTDTSPDEAFTLLRSHARRTGSRLTDLCRAIIDRTVDPDAVLSPRGTRADAGTNGDRAPGSRRPD